MRRTRYRCTLTVFPADPSKANGTAVVICPGGAFFALSIDSEGFDVARWLNTKGVTCFVLKYRLVECKTDDPTRELMTRGKLDEVVAPVVKLAMADGIEAIGYVRSFRGNDLFVGSQSALLVERCRHRQLAKPIAVRQEAFDDGLSVSRGSLHESLGSPIRPFYTVG